MTNEIILTPTGVKKLNKEVAERKQLRKEISHKINLALEHGDLSENAEYHQAKEEQAFNEGRILEIETLLREGIVVHKQSSSVVGVGSKIKIQNNDKELEYTIVGATEADPSQGMISCESPLAISFLGKQVGDEVEVQAPAGKVKYKIIDIQ